jgi:DNA-binding FrmR family transcriptional regulator
MVVYPSQGGRVSEATMQADKQDALRRLAYIEGHLKGIRKMVEDDQYCVDILKQTHAVKRALDKFDSVLLGGHLAGCVPEGIREGRDQQVIGELKELFELSRR